jgi:hypothetical protein
MRVDNIYFDTLGQNSFICGLLQRKDIIGALKIQTKVLKFARRKHHLTDTLNKSCTNDDERTFTTKHNVFTTCAKLHIYKYGLRILYISMNKTT